MRLGGSFEDAQVAEAYLHRPDYADDIYQHHMDTWVGGGCVFRRSYQCRGGSGIDHFKCDGKMNLEQDQRCRPRCKLAYVVRLGQRRREREADENTW